MVKSKFPGKPSKLVQRKLVSAYSIAVPVCDTSSVTENICYGLSVFETNFGREDDTEAADCIGFENKEIQKSRKKSTEFRVNAEEKFSFRGKTCIPVLKKPASIQPTVDESIKAGTADFEPSRVAPQPEDICTSNPGKEPRNCDKVWFVSKKVVNKYHSKLVLRHGLKGLEKTDLIRLESKPLTSSYLTTKCCSKFNLPSHSLHSSRVIKPNKRFIDNNEKNNKIRNTDKLVAKGDCSDENSKDEILSDEVAIQDARLNITTEPAINGLNVLRSEFLDCGVCGAIRHRKNVIQSRKFGIYSCESCRRFMLKMIKQAKHFTDDVLNCEAENGIGKCVIATNTSRKDDAQDATVKSNHCDACWLNVCLQRCKLSKTLRRSLMRLIPQDLDMVAQVDYLTESSNLQPTDDSSCSPCPIDPANISELEFGRMLHRSSSGNSDEKTGGQVNNDNKARSLLDFTKDSYDDFEDIEEKLISTDFWEAYDPDEIFKIGFPLITSEPINVRALCFLCGSAGLDKLLYCIACCEPYHWYCIEGPSAFHEETELEKLKVTWVCRKCKVCKNCGKGSSLGNLTSCKRCKNSYHPQCLGSKAQNKRLIKSDRPWVCPSCLKCKSCNSNSVFTHVGNIPLCSQCFKLRQKGNYCTLCQGCYQDEDYNVPMMECGMCKRWIHATCEGISYEKYQILSFLPDSVEFVCRLCCSTSPAQWYVAIENELKAGFYGILKCLCNNKRIGDILKDSLKKENSCSCSITQKEPEHKTFSDFDNVNRALSFAPADVVVESDNRTESEEIDYNNSEKIRSCTCQRDIRIRNEMSERLLAIKVNVHNNPYASVSAFHRELENVLSEIEEFELMNRYAEILKQFFPWFDPNHVQLEQTPGNQVETVSNENASVSDNDESNSIDGDEYALLRKLIAVDECVNQSDRVLDVRKCNLCRGMGEAVPLEGGRLIYCGRNEWVHSNCALWSSEVFEEIDGSLQNVHSAISRSRHLRCSVCDQKGASVGCCFKNCVSTYHFTCAKKNNCIFMHNKTTYCSSHGLKQLNWQSLADEKDFEILRPVYIEIDRRKKKFERHANVRLRVGSLHVESLGEIDLRLSDKPKYLLPIYYRCVRLFWSTSKPWTVIQYDIQIKVNYSYERCEEKAEVNYTVDHSKGRRGVVPGCNPQNARRSMMENGEPVKSVQVNENENYSKEDPHFPKNKRKMDSVNSTFSTKKKMTRENVYISPAKMNRVVVDCYRAFENIMQLDGMVDMCTDDEPVLCNQCGRAYRTTMGYEQHLDMCSTDSGDLIEEKKLEKSHMGEMKLSSVEEPSSETERKSWRTASILYEVSAEDGFTYKTDSLLELWTKIMDSVQQSRANHKLPLLPKNALIDDESVYGLLGFENKALKYLLEQLPDVWKCVLYKPVFHKSSLNGKAFVPKNASGCARTEPFNGSHKYDMFGWLASRHRKPPRSVMMANSDVANSNRRITSLNLPMAMRFRHLKETAKETVCVFRSDIQGRGLFCIRDIDAGEMVIEYSGEMIRASLTDKREKYYTSKGIGCYMFRIDNKYVVDSTMCGNAARFINHSCDPNCYSRIVDILGRKHIIIFALKSIPKGEELTYDYKFPREEDKIQCHCLARKCRKYLN